MARYFFSSEDGEPHRDEEGIDLKDHAAARVQAIRYAGEVMASEPEVLWDGREFNVYVSDADRALLFTITCYATNMPSAGDVR